MIMRNLPNFEKAEINPQKFTGYSMNPYNIGNQNKWMAFGEIGYNVHHEKSRENAALDVIAQLKNSLPYVQAVAGKMSRYGQRYKLNVEITGTNGKTGTLVTVWQIEKENIPGLITNWLEVHR